MALISHWVKYSIYPTVSLWLYIISIPINIFNSPWQVGRLRQVLAVIYIIIITTVFVVIIILEIQKVRVILKFVADTVSKMRQLLFLFICLPPLLNTKEASLSISWCLFHRKCPSGPGRECRANWAAKLSGGLVGANSASSLLYLTVSIASSLRGSLRGMERSETV